MADDFKSLLDEQKKSNEILIGMRQDQAEQGSAKEIIKQSLPEVLNERQLASKRDKFFTKTGMTETDDKIDNLKETIQKKSKEEVKEEKLSSDKVGNFLEKSNSSLKQLYNLQFAFGLGQEKMQEATRKFNNAFYGKNRVDAVREKKQLELDEERLELQKTEIERRGGVAEEDAKYKIDMLAIERRKARLERRNRTGLTGRLAAEAKNRARMLKELVTTRAGIYMVADGVKGLAKGLFSGAGKVVGAGFGALKKFALLAFLPAVLAFLNSEFWETTKEFIADKLIPAVKTLFTDYIKPFALFLGEKLLAAWDFIMPYIPRIIEGLKIFVDDYLKPFGGFLLRGLRGAFNLLADFFFGREIQDEFTGETFRSGRGLFGKIGSVINFFKDLPSNISNTFKNVVNKIKGFFDYIFSFDLLADIFDRVFPDFKNPFRKKTGLYDDSSDINRERKLYDAPKTVAEKQIQKIVGDLDQTTETKVNLLSSGGLIPDPEGLRNKIMEEAGFVGLTEGKVTESRNALEKFFLRFERGMRSFDNLSVTQAGKFAYAASPTIINAPMNTVNSQSNTQVQSQSLTTPMAYNNMVKDFR